MDRLAAFEPRPPPPVARGPISEPLSLSFGQVDDYLTCPEVPLRARAAGAVAPHHAMVYGSALHKAVQEFHRRHARGDVMSETS